MKANSVVLCRNCREQSGHSASTDVYHEIDIPNCHHGRKQCVRLVGAPVNSLWLDGRFTENPLRPVFGRHAHVPSKFALVQQAAETGTQTRAPPASQVQPIVSELEAESTLSCQSQSQTQNPPRTAHEHGPSPDAADPLADTEESRSQRLQHEPQSTAKYTTVVFGQCDHTALHGQGGPVAAAGWELGVDDERFVSVSQSAPWPTIQSGPPLQSGEMPVYHDYEPAFGSGADQHVSVATSESIAGFGTGPTPESITFAQVLMAHDYITPRHSPHIFRKSVFHNTDLEIMHHHVPFERIPFELLSFMADSTDPHPNLPVSPEGSNFMAISANSSLALSPEGSRSMPPANTDHSISPERSSTIMSAPADPNFVDSPEGSTTTTTTATPPPLTSAASSTSIISTNSSINIDSDSFGKHKYYDVQNEALAELVRDSTPLFDDHLYRESTRLDFSYMKGFERWVNTLQPPNNDTDTNSELRLCPACQQLHTTDSGVWSSPASQQPPNAWFSPSSPPNINTNPRFQFNPLSAPWRSPPQVEQLLHTGYIILPQYHQYNPPIEPGFVLPRVRNTNIASDPIFNNCSLACASCRCGKCVRPDPLPRLPRIEETEGIALTPSEPSSQLRRILLQYSGQGGWCPVPLRSLTMSRFGAIGQVLAPVRRFQRRSVNEASPGNGNGNGRAFLVVD